LKKFLFILILCSPVLATEIIDPRLRPVTKEIIEKLREDTDLYFEDKDGDGMSGDYFYINPMPDDGKAYILDGNREWVELKNATEFNLQKYRIAYKNQYGKEIPKIETDPAIKTNPLEVAAREMRNSADSLGEKKIESAVKSQEQVLAALKEFLARQEGDQNNNNNKNKNRNKNNNNKRRRQQGQQRQQSGRQKSGQQQSSSQTPAQSSTSGSGFNLAKKGSRDKMETEIWGKLKDKITESNKTGVAKDRFLPIYSDDLEDYFEQLSRKKLRRN